MANDFCYAGYPAAVIYNKPNGKAHYQLLWGRYIGLTGNKRGDWLELSRGRDKYWVQKSETQLEPILKIIFVDIGQGDGCLVTTPENEQIVIDAGQEDNMYRFLKDKFGRFKSSFDFQSFIITHPDQDHYLGFKPLFEEPNVNVGAVYHSGLVERVAAESSDSLGVRKKFGRRSYVTELIADKTRLDNLLTRKKIGRKKYPGMLRSALDSGRVGDFKMINAQTGFLPGYEKSDGKDLFIEVLGPVPEYPDPAKSDTPHLRWLSGLGKTKNGHSLILRLVYKKISVLLGGDLNIPAENYLLNHYAGERIPPRTEEAEKRMIDKARSVFQSDFAKACHHGSSDFTDLFLKAVNAKATVISSGDNEPHAHPRADTIGTLGKQGRGRRPLVFSTELARSAKEKIKNPSEFRQRIRDAVKQMAAARKNGDPARIKSAEKGYEKILGEIERSISTYGAVNLRTDGENVVMAYKIEAPRKKSQIWDIYKFERDEISGELVFLSKHH